MNLAQFLAVQEYTVSVLVAVPVVIALEFAVFRTGIFAKRAYWISMAIVFFFQCLVDGWLTKLIAPIVIYEREEFSGIRFPFDIPIEDFGFGFAMITLTLLVWEWAGNRRAADAGTVGSR